MADLRTSYLGLELDHPVVASASPLSRTLDGIRSLEDGGASAIVLASLFEEQINGSDRYGGTETDAYLELIRQARQAVSVPVIASLNATADEGWTRHAAAMHEAGASAIELNIFHIPADPAISGRVVEQRYIDIVLAVRAATNLRLAVKIAPYFSSIGEMARRLIVAGADGLVLFNRFYQPDIDLETRNLVTTLELSARQEIRLPLLWIGLLYGRLPCNLAATTGVETSGEVVKYLLAGADVVMTTSSLLRNGPGHIRTLVTGLRRWLDQNDYATVRQSRGTLSHARAADPGAFERANYVRMLQEYRSYAK
jgi:dihydroorotate dehydrogenase (fumarate)